MSNIQFRDLLEQGDALALWRAWHDLFPGMPQPKSVEQAEIVMHRARTEAASITLAARVYSHRWLVERELPSGLPDRLKPSAEQICPRVVQGVGIGFKTSSEFLKPALMEVRGAMEDAVLEADADGKLADSAHVTARMQHARQKTLHALFGH
jgi:hypothetical protein